MDDFPAHLLVAQLPPESLAVLGYDWLYAVNPILDWASGHALPRASLSTPTTPRLAPQLFRRTLLAIAGPLFDLTLAGWHLLNLTSEPPPEECNLQ